jgi:predicted SAM-dependent methyltransferase
MPGAVRACLGAARRFLARRRARRLLGAGRPVFLELGAGGRKGTAGWLTVDLAGGCDIRWDLREGLPFPDASVAKIYSSHFLEHLSYREGQRLLEECRRVLAPGGGISVCVPNARLYIEAYLRSETLDEGRFFSYRPAFNGTTKIDYVNFTAYMDGTHRYMFDEENLLHVLAARGFRNARVRGFDPALDLARRDYESIYAEAEK